MARRAPDGSFPEMASDLKGNYPGFPEEMAVVLRGYMAAELRRRMPPSPDPTAAAGAMR